jgi:hypothetical protein
VSDDRADLTWRTLLSDLVATLFLGGRVTRRTEDEPAGEEEPPRRGDAPAR